MNEEMTGLITDTASDDLPLHIDKDFVIRCKIYHTYRGNKSIDLEVAAEGRSLTTAKEVEQFFSAILGFDLQRHNDYLGEKNSKLTEEIDLKKRQLEVLNKDIERMQQRVKEGKEWLTKVGIETNRFDDVPF